MGSVRVRRACRLGLMLVLLPSLSLSAFAAQLTFRQAVQLAAPRRAAVALPSADQTKAYEACADAGDFRALQMATSSVFGGSPDSPSAQAGTFPSAFDTATQRLFMKSLQDLLMRFTEEGSQASVQSTQQIRDAVLCTAVAYAELDKVDSQTYSLRRQETAVERLLNIEARRVVARADNPLVLTRAKLLAARTRMWAAGLEDSERQLRKQLADLTGLPEEEIAPVSDSMPPLPNTEIDADWLQAPMRQLAAARDVAQLEDVLARAYRMKTRVNVVLNTATLGDLVAAYITEEERFNALLEINFQFERMQLQLLHATGKLKEWALGDAASGSGQPTPQQGRGTEESKASAAVQSIMITPALSVLVAGQSQQFSAITIYRNGKAKDVTREAVWQCSSNSGAIVSTSGLVTALSTGQVTISATSSGVSKLRLITITPEDLTFLDLK